MPTSQSDFSSPAPQSLGDAELKQKTLSFGEKLVGLNFNPSNDDAVSKAKRLCADLADLLENEVFKSGNQITTLQSQLYNHTIGQILNAQMNVVKVLTLKY